MAGISDLLGSVGDYLGGLDTTVGDIIAPRERQAALLQNLQAQGYLGQDVSGGIVESRGPIGGLLQALHIVGAPSLTRPISPYEQLTYQQGQVGKQEEGLGLQGKKLAISGAEQSQKLARLSAMGALAKEGQMPPASDFGDMTPDESAALQGIIDAYNTKTKLNEESRRTTIDYNKALLNRLNNPAAKTVNVFDQMNALAKLPANKPLVSQIQELYYGGGKDDKGLPVKGVLDESDQTKKLIAVSKAQLLLKRLAINLYHQGVHAEGEVLDPRHIEGTMAYKMALDSTLGQEPNMFTDVLGLGSTEATPEALQQLHNITNPPGLIPGAPPGGSLFDPGSLFTGRQRPTVSWDAQQGQQ